MGWTPEALPDLAGRTYLVTGANSGVGFEASRLLASRRARVLVGCRSEERAKVAIALIQAETPDADLGFVPLDLADPDSIAAAAKTVNAGETRLDAVVNNAGVMQTPQRTTKEGFELQFSTNHLGHFRLNRDLWPLVSRSEGRFVAVSSMAHRGGWIRLDDLMHTTMYDPTVVYAQTKLANLMYALELHRRLQAVGSPVRAIAVHPGYAATNLQFAGPGLEGGSRFWPTLYAMTNRLLAQSAELGGWPLALGAADPDAKSGAFYGPRWLFDSRGPIGEVRPARQARNQEVARKLWEATEALVGPWALG